MTIVATSSSTTKKDAGCAFFIIAILASFVTTSFQYQ